LDSLERTDRSSPDTRWSDAVGIGLLLVLVLLSLPALGLSTGLLPGKPFEHRVLVVHSLVAEVVDRLTSCYLLPTLAFCLVLRRRRIDLSVWAIFALGGVTMAWLINRGVAAPWAMLVGVLLGATLGLLAGVAIVRLRAASLVATALTGLLAMGICAALGSGRAVPVAESTFHAWYLEVEVSVEAGVSDTPSSSHQATPRAPIREHRPAPPAVTRMLIAASGYALAMLALVVVRIRQRHHGSAPEDAPHAVLATLAASGALAALGGAAWLVEHNSAPVATRLVGDLQVPAAALLAGALLLVGPGRTLLMGLCLPAALLAASVWRQELTYPAVLRSWGYEAPSAMLALMVLSVHVGMLWWRGMAGRGRWLTVAFWALALGGLLVTALQTVWASYALRHILHTIGVPAWLLGAGGLLVCRASLGLRAGPDPQPCPDPPSTDPA
jgi:ribose/xylose/arabinose/galactoside ABC-type transport system permease subunit